MAPIHATVRFLTARSCTSFVPHPFAFFLAKGWDTSQLKRTKLRGQRTNASLACSRQTQPLSMICERHRLSPNRLRLSKSSYAPPGIHPDSVALGFVSAISQRPPKIVPPYWASLTRISHGPPKIVAPASRPAVLRASRPSATSRDLESSVVAPPVRNAG